MQMYKIDGLVRSDGLYFQNDENTNANGLKLRLMRAYAKAETSKAVRVLIYNRMQVVCHNYIIHLGKIRTIANPNKVVDDVPADIKEVLLALNKVR